MSSVCLDRHTKYVIMFWLIQRRVKFIELEKQQCLLYCGCYLYVKEESYIRVLFLSGLLLSKRSAVAMAFVLPCPALTSFKILIFLPDFPEGKLSLKQTIFY